MKKLDRSGFSVVEVLLVLILLAILGFTGFYVWNAQHNTNKSLNAANKTAASTPTTKTTKASSPTLEGKDGPGLGDPQQYVTIKEWGVRAPYNGTLHLTYTVNNNGGNPPIYAASFTSTELGGTAACVAGGGIVERAYADTVLDGGGTTAGQANSPYTTTKVGNYYYVYIHPQSACSDNTSVETQTDNDVQALVKNLQAY